MAVLLFLAGAAVPAGAVPRMPSDPEIPPGADFVRSVELEGYVQEVRKDNAGVQGFRLQSRYLDPEVKAFVGLVTQMDRYNKVLTIGDPASFDTSRTLWTFGANIGFQTARHVWILDVQGTSLASRLGFSPGIGQEHVLVGGVGIFHRARGFFFTNDTLGESDQGIFCILGPFRLYASYRFLAGRHLSRQGPRVGATFRFQSPKIPFIFPSIG